MVFRPSALVLEVWEEDFCAALVVALGCDAEAAASIPAIVEAVPLSTELPRVTCFRVAVNVKPPRFLASWVLWSCWMTRLLMRFLPV